MLENGEEYAKIIVTEMRDGKDGAIDTNNVHVGDANDSACWVIGT